MISNQIIQTTIDDLRGITRIDLCVLDVNGSRIAATFDAEEISKDILGAFADSPAVIIFSRFTTRDSLAIFFL